MEEIYAKLNSRHGIIYDLALERAVTLPPNGMRAIVWESMEGEVGRGCIQIMEQVDLASLRKMLHQDAKNKGWWSHSDRLWFSKWWNKAVQLFEARESEKATTKQNGSEPAVADT